MLPLPPSNTWYFCLMKQDGSSSVAIANQVMICIATEEGPFGTVTSCLIEQIRILIALLNTWTW